MPNSIDFSQIKAFAIPEGDVVKIHINGTLVWKKGPTNQVPLSINADGSVYNGGLGYKNGYRVRSGGAEQAYNNASCTGFIKVNPGDVVRLSGWDFSYTNNGNAINASDSSFANIGQFTMNPAQYGIFAGAYKAYSYTSVVEESEGVWKWIVPPEASDVVYIRVSGYGNVNGNPGSNLIVTINEEIT